MIINTIFSVALLLLVISLKGVSYYGLTKVTNLKGYLYFIPLLLIVSVNLLNGADFIPTLMQICYAMAIGYLFVIIFYKSKSLVPCIIAHSINNSLSIFNVENELSMYIAPIFLIVVPLAHAFYINGTIKE